MNKKTIVNEIEYPLLESIERPEDLRRLPEDDLPAVGDEIRRINFTTQTKTGGHQSNTHRAGEQDRIPPP